MKKPLHYVDCNVISLYVARPSSGEVVDRLRYVAVQDVWRFLRRKDSVLISTTVLIEEASRGHADAARKRARAIRRFVKIHRETAAMTVLAGQILSQVRRKNAAAQEKERDRLRNDAHHYAGACVLKATYLLSENDSDFHFLAKCAVDSGYKGHKPVIEVPEATFSRLVRENPPRAISLVKRLFSQPSPWISRISRDVERVQIQLAREARRAR